MEININVIRPTAPTSLQFNGPSLVYVVWLVCSYVRISRTAGTKFELQHSLSDAAGTCNITIKIGNAGTPIQLTTI